MQSTILAGWLLTVLLAGAWAGELPARFRTMKKPMAPSRGRTSVRAAALPPKRAEPRRPQPAFAGHVSLSASDRLTISHGTTATIGQFPWQVALVMDGTTFCGGSIISEVWVLTAGHCTDGAVNFVVTAGTLLARDAIYDDTTYTETRQRFLTTEQYRHPHYSNYHYDNDVSLLRLQTEVEFNDVVKPVRLPSYTMALDSLVGQRLLISGWGWAGDEHQSITAQLLYTTLTGAENSICNDYYGHHVLLSNKICLSTEDTNSTCKGDSGGPLVMEEEAGVYTVFGIVSFGSSEGCSQLAPVGMTKVTSFLDFIEDITGLEIRE